MVEVLVFRKVKGKTNSHLVLTQEGADYIVELLAVGCTMNDIADELGISTQTLYSQWNSGILESIKKKGAARFRNSIRRIQFEQALSGSATAAIWLGKNYLGQSDTPTSEEVLVSPLAEYIQGIHKRAERKE